MNEWRGAFQLKKTTITLLALSLVLQTLSATAYAETAAQGSSDTANTETVQLQQTNADQRQEWRAPLVETVVPANGSIQVATNTPIIMIFNEDVSKNQGNLILRDANGAEVEKVSVTDNRIKVDGRKVEWQLSKALADGTKYSIQVDYGAFKGEKGEFAGIYGSSAWSFTTAVVLNAPELVALSPANGEKQAASNTSLFLTFNEEVWKQAGDIVITNLTRNTVEEKIAITSKQVTGEGTKVIAIKPENALKGGEEYAVTITPGALKDADNLPYSGIVSNNQWKFTVKSTADTTAPALKEAKIESSTKLRLVYNEKLNESSIPPLNSFTVYVNGESRALKNVTVSGTNVDVELKSGVSAGQVIVLVYAPQAGQRVIEDAARNAAAPLGGVQVQNGMETTAPKVVDATFSGSRIVIQFSESLEKVSSSALSQFKVWVDGKEKSISKLEHSGAQLTLVMKESIGSNKTVKFSYTAGSYPLRDTAGNLLQSFKDRYARGNNDKTAPVFQSASVKGNILTLQYNEPLATDRVPLRSYYSVLVNQKARYVDKVTVSGNQVLLTLNSAVASSDTVLVSYVAGDPQITDLSGNAGAAFNYAVASNQSDTTAPSLKSGVAKGSVVTLTFSEKLKLSSNTTVGTFYVYSDGVNKTVNSTTVSGDTVTLYLSSMVSAAADVTVTYVPTSNPIQDESGNVVQSFANKLISNQTDGTTGRPAELTKVPYDWYLQDGLYVLSTAAASSTSTERSHLGQSVKRYTLSDSKLLEAFRYTIRYGSDRHMLFEVPSSEKAAMVAVPLSTLETIQKESSNAKFSVRYGDALYTVALDSLGISSIKNKFNFGQNAFLLMQIESAVSNSNGANLLSKLQSAGATVKVIPYDFYLSAYSNSSNAYSLDSKVEIRLRTTSYLTKLNTSVFRFDDESNRVQYVPGSVTQSNNTSIFRFNSRGGDIYAVAEQKIGFSDTGSHWARAAIEELASRYIIEAGSYGNYGPNVDITRGEFAVMVARAFGLESDSDAAGRFRDIGSNHAMAASIGAATKAGIINGFVDGTFKPNNNITREQMAVMVVRAMEVAGKPASYNSSALQKFKDRNKIGGYAREAVIQAVSSGLIAGVSNDSFNPAGKASRAQATVMLQRVLQQVGYLTK